MVEKLQEQAEQVAVARPAPSIEAPQTKTIETKESETNTDAYQEPPTPLHTAPPVPAVRTRIPEVGTSRQPAVRIPSEEILDTPDIEHTQPTPTVDTLREHIGYEIDEVISTAQRAVQQELDKDAKSGQKKNSV